MNTIDVKPGFVRRVAVLVCVAFAGCTAWNHQECEEFPSIHGPCSWQHSAWQTVGVFVFSTVSMGVLLVASLWAAGVIDFRRKRS